jgi:GntR family transcriptional regulator
MAQQPMYQQIADELRKQIEAGILKPGAQLPTEFELRERHQASRNTIRDAIKRLMSQGLVETRPGQGTFVTKKIDPFVTVMSTVPAADPASRDDVDNPHRGLGGSENAAYLSEVSQDHRAAQISSPKVEVQPPPPDVALRLRLKTGDQAVSRHQERFIDGTPWSLQTTFYPFDFIIKGATRLLMADDITEGTVTYLRDTLGIKQVGYRDWITARVADKNEQEYFGLPHDATVFVVYRTAFDQTGTPLRVTVTVFPADRNQFIINVGEVPPPEYAQPTDPAEAAPANQASAPLEPTQTDGPG